MIGNYLWSITGAQEVGDIFHRCNMYKYTNRTKASSSPKSMLNPTVMKKNPSRRPLKGAMSDSIWYRYFVSANSNPARKAPRVLDRPIPARH